MKTLYCVYMCVSVCECEYKSITLLTVIVYGLNLCGQSECKFTCWILGFGIVLMYYCGLILFSCCSMAMWSTGHVIML